MTCHRLKARTCYICSQQLRLVLGLNLRRLKSTADCPIAVGAQRLVHGSGLVPIVSPCEPRTRQLSDPEGQVDECYAFEFLERASCSGYLRTADFSLGGLCEMRSSDRLCICATAIQCAHRCAQTPD